MIDMDNSFDILLTPKEAKAFLKVSIPTLNKLVAQGKFNKYNIPDSKRVYFKKQEIIDALKVVDPEERARVKLLEAIFKNDKIR